MRTEERDKGNWHLRIKMIGLMFCAVLIGTLQPASAGQVKLTYLSWILAETGGPEYLRQIAEFEKQNPNIKVEAIPAPLLGYPTRFATQARAGEMPDLVTVDLAWIQGWIQEEFLRDMTPLIAKVGGQKYLGEYYDTLIKLGSRDGKVFGLPRVAGGYLLYYNKDMFKEAGLDPAKPPTNWDELIQDARKLTKKDASGKVVQYGYGLHGMNRTDVVSRFVNWMYANGADVISADGKRALLDQPKAIETLRVWSDLYKKEGIVPPGVIQAHPGTVRSQFAQKQIAMELGILWGVDMIFAENPALRSSLAVAPFPKQNPNNPSNFQAFYEAVTATSKHPEEAFRLLEFMLRPENQLSLFKASRYGPTQARVFRMPEVANDPYAQVMAKVNERLKPLPSIPQWEQASKIIGDAMQLTLNGTKTPEVAFKDANSQINEILK